MAISIEEMNSQLAEAVPAREVMTTVSRRSSYKSNVWSDSSIHHNLNDNLSHSFNDNFSHNNVLSGNDVAVLSGNESNTKTITDVTSLIGLEGDK